MQPRTCEQQALPEGVARQGVKELGVGVLQSVPLVHDQHLPSNLQPGGWMQVTLVGVVYAAGRVDADDFGGGRGLGGEMASK